jgi:hypothetical protein
MVPLYTFSYMDETYYENIKTKPYISIEVQTKAALQTGHEQLSKIQLNNEHGADMYRFLMNVGNLFTDFNKDHSVKYPETNQFAFLNEADIERDSHLQKILNNLIKWGGIIKKSKIQGISIGKRKGVIYHINRVFSPFFQISYRTRGGYNFLIEAELFRKMSKDFMEVQAIKSYKNKTTKDSSQTNIEKAVLDNRQLNLFESENLNGKTI